MYIYIYIYIFIYIQTCRRPYRRPGKEADRAGPPRIIQNDPQAPFELHLSSGGLLLSSIGLHLRSKRAPGDEKRPPGMIENEPPG